MKENSIEEALKKLSTGKKIKMYELLRTFKKEGIENFVITRKKYVDVILSDYKRVLKENEELKFKERSRIIGEYGDAEIHDVINKTLSNDYISVQKVKDKIKKEIKYHEKNILDIENITMLKGKTAKEEAEIEFNKYAIVVLKKMLQELLEGKK